MVMVWKYQLSILKYFILFYYRKNGTNIIKYNKYRQASITRIGRRIKFNLIVFWINFSSCKGTSNTTSKR